MKGNCKHTPLNQQMVEWPYIKTITCANEHKYKPQFAHFGEIEKTNALNADQKK